MVNPRQKQDGELATEWAWLWVWSGVSTYPSEPGHLEALLLPMPIKEYLQMMESYD